MNSNNKKKRLLILLEVLLVVSAFSCFGCSSKEEKASNLIQIGDRLLSEGDPADAIREYKSALQIDPKSGAAYSALGKALLRQNDPIRAFDAFKRAVELEPDRDEARIELAFLMSVKGRGQEALDEIERISDLQPFQPRAKLIRARAFMNGGRFAEAVSELEAIENGGENPDVLALLTVCYKETRSYEKLEKSAAQWRSVAPKDHRPYVLMARHAAARGNKKQVLEELDALVEQSPEESHYKFIRAKTLEDIGFEEEAKSAFQELPREVEMLRAQAGFWQRRKEPGKAREALEQLLSQAPTDADAYLQLSHVLVSKGEIKEAIERLDAALQLELRSADREKIMISKATLSMARNDPAAVEDICKEVLKLNEGNLDAHLLLGRVLLQSGRAQEAEAHLHQVAVARPEEPIPHILLSKAQLSNKKDAEAHQTLRSALEANPLDLEIMAELAAYHTSRRELDLALSYLDQGLRLKPGEPAFLNKRADLFILNKDLGRAEKDLRELIRARPDLSIGYMKLGQVLSAQSKTDEALELFGKALSHEDAWHTALPAIVNAQMQKKQPKAALAAVEAEAAKRPRSPLAHYYLGQTLVKTGQPAKAEAPFLKAVDLAPEWIDPYRSLADLYASKGKKEARKKLEELYNQKSTPAAALMLAFVCEEQGSAEDADRFYAKALEKSNHPPNLLNQIAFLSAEHRTDPKSLERASELAAQAVAQQPDNALYLDTLAWIAFKQGKLDESWSRLQEVLAKQPDMPSANLHAAVLSHARGKKQEALKYLDKAVKQAGDLYSQKKALSLKKEWEG